MLMQKTIFQPIFRLARFREPLRGGAKVAVLIRHPIHVKLHETANKIDDHGGMGVYDFAKWCTLAPLTKISIENNSAPVEIQALLVNHGAV